MNIDFKKSKLLFWNKELWLVLHLLGIGNIIKTELVCYTVSKNNRCNS